MLPFQIYCKRQNNHSHSCKQWILHPSFNQAFTKIMQICTSHDNKYHVGCQLTLSLFLERSARCGERTQEKKSCFQDVSFQKMFQESWFHNSC